MMKLKVFLNLAAIFVVAIFSYITANAQIVEKVKDAAKKTKDVTVDAAKKTADVTKDAADKTKDVTVDAAEKTKDVTVDTAEKTKDATVDAADKTKDVTVDAAKTTGSGAQKISGYTVKITDNVKEQSAATGKWLVMTTWDGTKWVTKRTWVETKKAADATKDAVVSNDENKKP